MHIEMEAGSCRLRVWWFWEMTYELVRMGATFGFFRGADGDLGEGGSGECELESGHGDSDGGDLGVCVERGIAHQDAGAVDHWAEDLDISGAVGVRHGAVVAVLFPGAATGGGLASGAGGQAERGDRHCARGDFLA